MLGYRPIPDSQVLFIEYNHSIAKGLFLYENLNHLNISGAWKHEWLSFAHREWGNSYGAVDIDCLLHGNNNPLHLIEFKNSRNLKEEKQNKSLEILTASARRSGIQFSIIDCDWDKNIFHKRSLVESPNMTKDQLKEFLLKAQHTQTKAVNA